MPRPSRWLLGTVFLLGLTPALRAGGLRVIASANVTLRQTPSAQAPAVAQLALGTEVSETGDADLDKTWTRVVTSTGKTGWVVTRLTLPLDPFWKWQTQERLIKDRLARVGDGFPASVELVDFVERIADGFTDPDGRARMDLYRLRALQQALSAIPFSRIGREPYSSWLARYKDWTVYSEPGGAWLVENAAIWKVHDARQHTSAADDLAWLTVSVGLPGECEGYVPCYLTLRDRLQGEYLRRHPSGAHASEALAAVSRTITSLGDSSAFKTREAFDPKTDCKAFLSSIESLRKAVEVAPRGQDRDASLANLAALSKRCG